MRKNLQNVIIVLSLIFFGALTTYASPTTTPIEPVPTRGEVQTTLTIDKDGNTLLKGARIIQIAGSNLFVTASWGNAKIRFVITTTKNTLISRRFGGSTGINEFSLDEYVNVEGTIYGSGGDSLVIKATSIKNWSKENEPGEFSGVIANLNLDKKTFTLILSDAPNILITAPSNLAIKKGSRTISLGDVANGDRVVSTGGIYNPIDRTLAIDRLEIFQEQTIFAPRNFQGTLKSLGGTSIPTTAVLTVDGKDYTVYLNDKTSVLNKLREKALLQRFVIGDTIRIFGAIRKTNLIEIDGVEIFRNINL